MNETRQQKHLAIIRIGDLIEWNCRGCGKNPLDRRPNNNRHNEWCAANCEIGKELRELGDFINTPKKVEKENVIVRTPKLDWEKELPKMREMKESGKTVREIGDAYGVSLSAVKKHLKEDKEFVPEDGEKTDIEVNEKAGESLEKAGIPLGNFLAEGAENIRETLTKAFGTVEQTSKVIARAEYDFLKKELDKKVEQLQQLQEYVNQKNEDIETYQKDNVYLEEKVNILEEQAKEKEESFLTTLKLKDDQIVSLQCSLNEKTTMLDYEKRKFQAVQAKLELVTLIAKAYLEDIVS